jgi:peptidyl-prolyl cis-trans isomerase SurA
MNRIILSICLVCGSLLLLGEAQATPYPSAQSSQAHGYPLASPGSGSEDSLASIKSNLSRVSEGILAQIGDKIILQSELETEFRNATDQERQEGRFNADSGDAIRCMLFEQMILGKMLQRQAELDSLVIAPEEVDNQLDRRIRHFATMMGGQERLEEFYGKTMPEIREEFRPQIKDMLLSQKMRDKITSDVEISPAEVQAHFAKIPFDSLPLVPAEVELGQIVINPKAGLENRTLAMDKIQGLRNRILQGESFATLAILYSQDPGSAREGGQLGFFGRGDMVSEFEAVAFRLKPGEVSSVVKTAFGYHIIQLITRRGERIQCRHILIKPPIGSREQSEARNLLDSVRGLLVAGKISFTDAVRKFSDDPETKAFGGMLAPPQGGSMAWPIDQLTPELYYAIEKINEGEYSEVQPYAAQGGEQGFRIVLLRKRSVPHRTSLETDYEKIQNTALQIKRIDKLNRWIERKAQETYVRLTPLAPHCPSILRWNF